MKSNHFWFLRIAFWLIGILVFLLLFVYPLISSWLVGSGRMPMGVTRYFWVIESAQTYLMGFLALLWIFFLGSCFASFLNVVAWRVPRGRSINGSSHCPDCNQKLRFRDNTPIVGWIRNGGQCSNCQLPIPVRYLVVEFVLGTIFLAFGIVQLILGGINLPLRTIEKLNGFKHLTIDPELIQLTLYHLILICVLFTFVLIRSENLKLPNSVWITGLVFGIFVPLIWPAATLIGWTWSKEPFNAGRFSFDQFATLGMGLLAGVVLGKIANGFGRRFVPEHPYVFQPTFVSESIASLSLIGLFLGWQSTLSIGVGAMCISILLRIIQPHAHWSSWSTSVFLATLTHMLSWRWLTECGYWPSATADVAVHLIAFLAFIILAWTKSQLEQSRTPGPATTISA